MAVKTEAVGKQYPSITYAVGREKIKEYARAVGETNPVHLDVEAARAAGYADVVAPPMFAVVYSAPAVGLPGKILHGLYTMAQGARAQTEAAGGPESLKRLSVQFRGMGYPEQEIVVRSTVREESGETAIVETMAEQGDKAIIRNAEAELSISSTAA